MSKLTIQRSRWARTNRKGEKVGGRAALLNNDGFMCCLGFDCLDLVKEKHFLLGVDFPCHSMHLRSSLPMESQITASHINDRSLGCNPNMTDEEQERLIAELFAQHGREVEFVD